MNAEHTLLAWPDEAKTVRHRARRRTQPVATRCVGSVALRPLSGELAAAVADTLAEAKRQQIQGFSGGTALTLDGYHRSTGAGPEEDH